MSRPETVVTADTPRPGDNAEDGPETDTDHDEQCCTGCGAHVSPDFRRVFGNNEDVVKACPECASMTDLTNGATIGKGGGR